MPYHPVGGRALLRTIATLIIFSFTISISIQAQAPDPQLLIDINKIKAIDNHAHPLRYVAEGDKPDDEFDALPLDAIESIVLPVRLSLDNPEFIGAWRHLYAYGHDDMSPAHVAELLRTKTQVYQREGDRFPNWVLDQLNIERYVE